MNSGFDAARAVGGRVMRLAAQGLAYAAFAAVTWYLSVEPRFSPIPPQQALVKVSFSHQGRRLQECRRRSAEELSRLAPNMRAAMDCPRERAPIDVEVELDGERLYRATLQPTGLSADGAAYVYERFAVKAGVHRLVARLRDDARSSDFTYTRGTVVELAPAEVLVVDFDAGQGGFVFRGGRPATEEEDPT